MIAPTYINAADEQTLRQLLRNYGRGKVLDVGCGRAQIKKYLPANTEYTGMDTQARAGVDIVGDIHQLPFPDHTFDTVLCTSVLEHVKNVDQVIGEMYRVLKSGGQCIVTIPFMLHYHKDPDDYVRLTHVGLTQALAKPGFTAIKTFRNNGVYTVVEYAFFSVLVHAKRENLFIKHWYLLPYYLIVFGFFIFFKIINYLTAPIQQFDTSLYVGVAAVATK